MGIPPPRTAAAGKKKRSQGMDGLNDKKIMLIRRKPLLLSRILFIPGFRMIYSYSYLLVSENLEEAHAS